MNVVMFVPIGFVHALSRGRARVAGRGAWRGALALGAALSGAVELAQVFTPDRFPSLFDLAANTAGSGLGAWLAGTAMEAAVRRGAPGVTVRTLAVDLPLMGLTYLTVPLVWLVALGADDPQRIWVMAPVAAAAAWAIASVFTSFDGAQRTRVLLVTAAWLVIALLPSARFRERVRRPPSLWSPSRSRGRARWPRHDSRTKRTTAGRPDASRRLPCAWSFRSSAPTSCFLRPPRS
jgi:hypothetical protein